MCGADLHRCAEVAAYPGSSPRVRGRLAGNDNAGFGHGLIPACAGQTLRSRTRWSRWRAHPRVCGADSFNRRANSRCGGSSPRVRGRQLQQARQLPLRGLIPACAGQTSPRSPPSPAAWAHPRVCGADWPLTPASHHGVGSSPRVRGRRRVGEGRGLTHGLIPACAGQTPARVSPPTRHPAHPRVCGAD